MSDISTRNLRRAVRRVEARRGFDAGAQGVERLGDADGQPVRERRGRHALRGAGEEFVAERIAQAAQRVGHRGLGHTERFRRGRGAAVGVDRCEHPQQIEVESVEVHGGSRALQRRRCTAACEYRIFTSVIVPEPVAD